MSISSGYLTLQPSYYIDLNEGHEELYDHRQVIHHHTTPFSFSSLNPHHNSSSVSSLSSSSSSPSPICLNSVQDQAGCCYMGSQIQPYPYQQEVEKLSSYERGSYDQTTLEINKRAKNGLKFSICKKEDKNFGGVSGGGGGANDQINGSSVKWMSSKMRLMKKMMKSEEDQKAKVDNRVDNTLVIKSSNNGCHNNNNNNNNNNENATIRVCSDCNTTKTPLWRSGPRGPKSLCNACGIRQRKARRAMAAAAITGNGSMLPSNPSSSMIRPGNNHRKTSIHNNNGFGAQKKRSKIAKPSQRKICFEEFALSLTKKLSIQQVFPKEEKEAAILLMALSCGLVHG